MVICVCLDYLINRLAKGKAIDKKDAGKEKGFSHLSSMIVKVMHNGKGNRYLLPDEICLFDKLHPQKHWYTQPKWSA